VWLPHEIEAARALFWRGELNGEIGKRLGRSRIAVKRAATAFGWKRGPRTPVAPTTFDEKAEKWAAIPNHTLYAVSTRGRVRKLVPDYRVLSPWIDKDGYAHVSLSVGREYPRYAIHRLLALAFLGEPPSPQHQVAHNDGSKRNFLGNLRWATPAENQRDRVAHGTAERDARGRLLPARKRGRAAAKCGTADMTAKAREAGVEVREIEGC
jgi:hypothetical protein